jgi:hypothetical protein
LRAADLVVFSAANVVNVLVAALFLARWRGFERAEYVLGLAVVAMIVPVCAAAALNAVARREWWTVVLPLVLAVYLLAELLLDYVFQVPFRETTLLWPYIAVFYAALWGMIGYSFLIGKPYGAVTLVTYFVQLGVMIFTHAKGGLHGGPSA